MDYNQFINNYRKTHEPELNRKTEELINNQEQRKVVDAENKIKYKRRKPEVVVEEIDRVNCLICGSLVNQIECVVVTGNKGSICLSCQKNYTLSEND